MNARALGLVSLALASACGSSAPPPSGAPASAVVPVSAPPTSAPPPPLAGHVVDGLFVPDGYTREPRACSVDADCTCNTEPIADHACCQDPVTLSCYRQDYWEALSAARLTACAEVTCPIPPAPMLPMACALTGRCADGRCGNACESAPLPSEALAPHS